MRMRLSIALLAVGTFGFPAVGLTEAQAARYEGTLATYVQTQKSHVPGPAGPTIQINEGDCPFADPALVGGCWIPELNAIWLNPVGPAVMFHELGHVFDDRNLDDEEREWIKPFIRTTGRSWHDGCDSIDENHWYVCPYERFAELYSACATNDRTYLALWAWRPSRERFKLACRLLRSPDVSDPVATP